MESKIKDYPSKEGLKNGKTNSTITVYSSDS